MLYEYKDKLGGNFVYWSNSCGDLHHNGEYDIDKVEDLPKELRRAYNELWCDGVYGLRCYLVEFNGKYGIAFEAGYSEGYADDLGITYEGLVNDVNVGGTILIDDGLIGLEVKAIDGPTKSLNNLIDKEKYEDIKYGIKFGYRNIGFNGKFYTFPYFLAFMLKRFLRERD